MTRELPFVFHIGPGGWVQYLPILKPGRRPFRAEPGAEPGTTTVSVSLYQVSTDPKAKLPHYPSVFVRFAQAANGRFVPVQVVVSGEEVVAQDLRHLPLAKLTALVNGPRLRADMAARLNDPAPDAAAALRAAFVDADRGAEPLSAGFGSRPRLKLKVPARADKGDAFYLDVALLYIDLVARSTPPARAIARANDVPVTTVHRWIKEARRRGFLAPGRKGTAG